MDLGRPETTFGEKIVLDLCADLATVEALDQLSEGQRIVFRERLQQAVEAAARSDLETGDAALIRLHSWLRGVVVPLANQPRGAHAERKKARSRAILLATTSGKERTELAKKFPAEDYKYVPPSALGAPTLSRFLTAGRGQRDWRVVVGTWGEVIVEEDDLDLGRGLEDVVWRGYVRPGTVFPFGRCANCHRIFVQKRGPQRYCSPTCAATANQENRRIKVRENVRRYRERKKKAKKGPG